MVKKKKEKEDKIIDEKPIKKKENDNIEDIEKFPISKLLEKNNIESFHAVGFLNYYGLTEDFKIEFETGDSISEFSDEEFDDMYKRYIEREI